MRLAAIFAATLLVAAAAVHVLTTPIQADDTPPPKPGVGVATFGSGCFWCTESDFDKVPGVLSTTSGYMGGASANPTYEQVSRGGTGHTEVLQVTYDTSKVSYGLLLEHYWKTTDVVDGGGQFCDRGHHYRPVIFTHDAEQARLAAEGKAALEASGKFGAPIAVEIAPAKAFGRAEAYHQDFYKTNPLRYLTYRAGCGRDARLDRLWGPGRLDHLKPKTQ